MCLSNSRCTEGLLQRLEALNQNANEHQRANVTIVYSSIDGLTSNPLSWCYLRNRFPNITFTLGIRLPEDDNHSVIRSFAFAHSDRHNAIRWAVYSVDVLSCLYPPLRGECSRSICAYPDNMALVSCDSNTIDAHKQFITIQLASHRWRRARQAAVGWQGPTYRHVSLSSSN